MSRAEPGLYRIIAVLFWLFSFSGNMLMFGGGWQQLGLNEHTATAFGISLAWQVICTALQFVCCKHWYNPVYLIALVASVVPAFIGYYPVVVIPLAQRLTHPLSWVIVAVVLIATDIIPERVFIKH
jgi:hypothetical protein